MRGSGPMRRSLPVVVLFFACATEAPPAKSGGDAARSGDGDDDGASLAVEGAVGALDPEAVRAKAGAVRAKAETCVADARKKLPYLGGDLDVALRVDGTGRAIEVVLTRSTLGHAGAEACIVEAFRETTWPRPVGGKIGEISQSYGFDAGYGELTEWSDGDLARAMDADAKGASPHRAFLDQLAACRREAGGARLLVTAYLDEDGFVQAVGLSSDDARGMAASTCVSTVVQTTSFPARDELVKLSIEVP